MATRPEIDSDTDTFRNLLSEPERFSLITATEALQEFIVLEIVTPEVTTEAALTIQIAELVRTWAPKLAASATGERRPITQTQML